MPAGSSTNGVLRIVRRLTVMKHIAYGYRDSACVVQIKFAGRFNRCPPKKKPAQLAPAG